MAKIGALELYTESAGWVELSVFEPGDFDWEPIEVKLENQWGVLHVTEPAEADTPFEIQTESRGWQAISTEALELLIDDFEHNNLNGYYGIADTANPPEIRTSASRSGTYGLYGYSDARAMSLPSWHSNYDSSIQSYTLDNYPSSGDVFEFYVYVSGFISGGSAINRFHFGKQDYEESANGYRVWWTFNDNYWRIERRVGGSGDTFADNRLSSNWPTEEWLRGVIDWTGTGFSVTMYRQNGTQIDTLSTNDTTYTSGGVGYDNGQYCISYTDDWRLINS